MTRLPHSPDASTTRRQGARAGRGIPFPGRGRAVLVAVALTGIALTGCAASPSPEEAGPAITLTVVQERASADVDTQLRELSDTELALDRLLLEESGLAESAGVDVDALLDRLHTRAPAETTAPAASPATAPAAPAAASSGLVVNTAVYTGTVAEAAPAGTTVEAANAAANGLSLVADGIRDSLGAAAQDDDSLAQFDSAPGANPALGWTVAQGAASGTTTSTISDTGPDGTRFEMVTESEYYLLVCPTADGSIDGDISVRSALTVTAPGGAPVRSVIELTITLGGTVNDKAYTVDSSADGTAVLSQGSPGAGAADLAHVASVQRTSVEGAFEYGDGAKDVRDIALEDAESTNLTTIADDLTVQMQQVLVRMAEDFWRGGNCVRAIVSPDEYVVARNASTGITVEAESIVDASTIERGEAEWTGVVAVGGIVTPTEAQKLPGAFVFEAADEEGWANPEFRVTTRRGIGVNVAPIQVGGAGWVVDTTVFEQHFTAVKCDGITGEWSMHTTGPEGYYADTAFVIGEDLRGAWDATVVSQYVQAGELWFVADGDGYVMHVSGGAFDPELPVRPATGECG